ncbi:MAG: hypothetical protein ILNGONEN_01572 [Syntrophorhabdaceae bacterium]|nr:hypothetical protein [Syntrophorhabdaceae bacterium]
MTKVFISHSAEDNEIAKRLEEALRRDDVSVWIDYANLKPGNNLPEYIGKAIEWCDTLIVIWSESAAKSKWVNLEWTSALNANKDIIPSRIDKTRLPILLDVLLWIDLSNFHEGYLSLYNALNPSEEPTEEPKSYATLNTKTLRQPIVEDQELALVGTWSLETSSPLEQNFSQRSKSKSKILPWIYIVGALLSIIILINFFQKTSSKIPFNFFFNTLKKGYLASIDFVFILLILFIGLFLRVMLYRVCIRRWIQNSLHPFKLRLLCGSLSQAWTAVTLLWFLYYVFNTQPNPNSLYLSTGIIITSLIVYFIIIWSKFQSPSIK